MAVRRSGARTSLLVTRPHHFTCSSTCVHVRVFGTGFPLPFEKASAQYELDFESGFFHHKSSGFFFCTHSKMVSGCVQVRRAVLASHPPAPAASVLPQAKQHVLHVHAQQPPVRAVAAASPGRRPTTDGSGARRRRRRQPDDVCGRQCGRQKQSQHARGPQGACQHWQVEFVQDGAAVFAACSQHGRHGGRRRVRCRFRFRSWRWRRERTRSRDAARTECCRCCHSWPCATWKAPVHAVPPYVQVRSGVKPARRLVNHAQSGWWWRWCVCVSVCLCVHAHP